MLLSRYVNKLTTYVVPFFPETTSQAQAKIQRADAVSLVKWGRGPTILREAVPGNKPVGTTIGDILEIGQQKSITTAGSRPTYSDAFCKCDRRLDRKRVI